MKIEYPAIQYYTPKERKGVTSAQILITPDGPRYLRLDEPARWPAYDDYVPGGVMDSSGRDIPIIGLTNWRPCPWWYRPLDPLFGIGLFGWPWRKLDIVFGEPVQLDLNAFKKKLCKIIYSERTMYHGGYRGYRAEQAAVKRASSFRQAIEEMYPPPGST